MFRTPFKSVGLPTYRQRSLYSWSEFRVVGATGLPFYEVGSDYRMSRRLRTQTRPAGPGPFTTRQKKDTCRRVFGTTPKQTTLLVYS